MKDDYTRHKKGFRASVVMLFFIVLLMLVLEFYQGIPVAFLIDCLILFTVIIH